MPPSTRQTRWGSIVYVIGGRSLAGNPLGNVMAYNVYTNTWTVKAPLPVPLYATNGVGVINGNLYILGGCRFPSCTRNGYSPALYMYDPTTNAWTRKSDMPEIGGYGGVTGVLGGKLYVLTTCIDVLDPAYYECEMLRTDSTGSRLAVYDPATNRWTRLRQADATYNVGAFIGGKFYVARGVRALPSVVYPGGLAVYDPATNRWSRKAPPPGVMGSAGVEMRGKLYVVGACVRYHADETSDTVRTTRVYDRPPTPGPRRRRYHRRALGWSRAGST
jgi:N-acetylneuraminic acid mutarotase